VLFALNQFRTLEIVPKIYDVLHKVFLHFNYDYLTLLLNCSFSLSHPFKAQLPLFSFLLVFHVLRYVSLYPILIWILFFGGVFES